MYFLSLIFDIYIYLSFYDIWPYFYNIRHLSHVYDTYIWPCVYGTWQRCFYYIWQMKFKPALWHMSDEIWFCLSFSKHKAFVPVYMTYDISACFYNDMWQVLVLKSVSVYIQHITVLTITKISNSSNEFSSYFKINNKFWFKQSFIFAVVFSISK